jgi:putative endonuclease
VKTLFFFRRSVEKPMARLDAQYNLLSCIPNCITHILTNQRKTVLYTGVTNDLKQRIIEHWSGCNKSNSFTSQYRAFYLLHYECYQYISDAIAREKEIKTWTREKKMELINKFNPDLKFLNEKIFGHWPPRQIRRRF